jgi:hypothetical protein
MSIQIRWVRLQAELADGPRRLVEFDAGVAVTLDQFLDLDEKVGPDRLRAGIAAPGAAHHRGDEKKADTSHHQKPGHEVELLWPDFDEEEIEAPVGHVEQHGLIRRMGSTIPTDPRRQVVDPQRDRHDDPLERRKAPSARFGNTFWCAA